MNNRNLIIRIHELNTLFIIIQSMDRISFLSMSDSIQSKVFARLCKLALCFLPKGLHLLWFRLNDKPLLGPLPPSQP